MAPADREAVDRKRRDVDSLMATPVKHWVRTAVWLPVAKSRYRQCGRQIKYFTLTTADLLDVKVLDREGLLEKNQRGYPGLGFCEMDDKSYSDIMRRVGWCGWSYKGRFEDMVRAHPSFEDRFSFDVVNLDFTGVPFPDHEAPIEGTWGAIKRMLGVQRNHGNSFDLFLTFRGECEQTDPVAIRQVADLLDSNLKAGRGRSEIRKRIGHTDIKRLLDDDYSEFLCLGLPKLLVGDALQLGYNLTHFETYRYPREGDEGRYHIVKLIFSFDVPQQSGRGFAQPPPLVRSYDEAVLMVFKRPVVDVDSKLNTDPKLVDQLERDMSVLQGS